MTIKMKNNQLSIIINKTISVLYSIIIMYMILIGIFYISNPGNYCYILQEDQQEFLVNSVNTVCKPVSLQELAEIKDFYNNKLALFVICLFGMFAFDTQLHSKLKKMFKDGEI